MTSTREANLVGGRMLDRLRSTAATREGDVYASTAFGEAARIADLLLCQSDNPEATSPAALAETLRAGAMALAATRFSFTRRHLLDRSAGPGESAVIDHLSEIAECLVSMADLLEDGGNTSLAEVIDLASRRTALVGTSH